MSYNNFVTVDTQHGPVKGCKTSTILGMDYIRFQSIPYMKAPVGKLRFRDAEAPEPWTETFDATKEIVAYTIVDFVVLKMIGQDDAGIINVFTKDVSAKKPVMVWIHGGGFQTGSSRTDLYGPDYLLQKDVVVVSFNYRVGALGFLSLDDPALKVPGNSGLKDQNFALKWIQKNIANFGGDENNVTLFGESAGGGSVHYHMISELSKGLFKRAIAMSGSVFNNAWTLQPRRNWAQRLAIELGYEGPKDESEILEFLESVETKKIVEASAKVLTDKEKYGEQILIPFGPTIEPYVSENCLIPESPLEMARNAWSNDIDCMIGGTSNEGLLMNYEFALTNNFKCFEILNNSTYFAPLLDLKLSLDDPKAEEIGKKLKQMYYGCTVPSKSNREGYFCYASDRFFWHGLQQAVLVRANSSGKGQTFLYRYDVLTELNFLKKLIMAGEYPGTEHGGDLSHLFSGTVQPPPKIDSKEFENVKKTVAIFTNFAITGNPNCAEIGNDVWESVNSVEFPLKCLNISTDKCNFIPLPETERLAEWNALYTETGVDLF